MEGDFLLRGTETVICRSDKMSQEVCCLPGAKIHLVIERLSRLIKSTETHPILLVHVGINDTARHRFQDIIRDFEELGNKAKDLKAKLVILSLLPVVGHGPRREEKIVEVNKWLCEWIMVGGSSVEDFWQGMGYTSRWLTETFLLGKSKM